MTYNVFSGTLNTTQSTQSSGEWRDMRRHYISAFHWRPCFPKCDSDWNGS